MIHGAAGIPDMSEERRIPKQISRKQKRQQRTRIQQEIGENQEEHGKEKEETAAQGASRLGDKD